MRLDETGRKSAELGLPPQRIGPMVARWGVVEALERLLRNGPTTGLENIVAAGHPELSCEHLMLVEFAHLFNKEDLEAACFNLNYHTV